MIDFEKQINEWKISMFLYLKKYTLDKKKAKLVSNIREKLTV